MIASLNTFSIFLQRRSVNFTDFNTAFWEKTCKPQFYLVPLYLEKHAMKSVADNHYLLTKKFISYEERVTHQG
jgi:hypothetical protein